MSARRFHLLLVLIIATGMLAACSSREAKDKTAVVFGDSLAFGARAAIKGALANRGWHVITRTFPFQTVCDWIPNLSVAIDAYHPSVIALQTIGNSFTGCMLDPQTGAFYQLGSPTYYERFRQDVAQFLNASLASGAKVVIVLPPPTGGPTAGLNKVINRNIEILRYEARHHPGTSVSASARNAVSNEGMFTFTKHCLADEGKRTGCDASTNTITVRTPDGVHFCPVPAYQSRDCPVYSAGAVRFGRAIAGAIVHPPPSVVKRS